MVAFLCCSSLFRAGPDWSGCTLQPEAVAPLPRRRSRFSSTCRETTAWCRCERAASLYRSTTVPQYHMLRFALPPGTARPAPLAAEGFIVSGRHAAGRCALPPARPLPLACFRDRRACCRGQVCAAITAEGRFRSSCCWPQLGRTRKSARAALQFYCTRPSRVPSLTLLCPRSYAAPPPPCHAPSSSAPAWRPITSCWLPSSARWVVQHSIVAVCTQLLRYKD